MPKSIFITTFTALILSLPFVLGFYVVEGDSMAPTFTNGDVLLVEKLSYRIYKPQRGELLVFYNPHNRRETLVKRVIGLPNERVELEDFIMQLGPNDYFVLGDNRSLSSDSRTFGAVQKTDMIGRAIITP